MFRFLHAADLHLDSPLRGLARHEGAPVEEIRGATRRALENLVELALSREVEFIVISGDLYDGDQRDFSTALFLNAQFHRLKAAGILVYVITGNHDAAAVLTKALTPPDNVYSFPVKKAASMAHPQLPVTVHGQGFAQAAVVENLVPDYPVPDPGHFNIGLLHTSLAGHPQHDNYAPCSLEELQRKGYQYWALGHIHQPGVLCQEPWIVYSGNLQGRHVRELGPRGCYVVEVSEELEVVDHKFVSLDVMRWAHEKIDLTRVTSSDEIGPLVAEKMNEVVEAAGGLLVALRLTLTGATSLHGSLHAEQARWQAELESLSQGVEGIWFERLRLRTRPVIDAQELASRDDLTAMVLAELDAFDPGELPMPVRNLLDKLPSEVESALAQDDSLALKDEVSALVLHSISIGKEEGKGDEI